VPPGPGSRSWTDERAPENAQLPETCTCRIAEWRVGVLEGAILDLGKLAANSGDHRVASPLLSGNVRGTERLPATLVHKCQGDRKPVIPRRMISAASSAVPHSPLEPPAP
jgi:hypothetical protein